METLAILIISAVLLYVGWALASGEHRYLTNHQAHNAFDKELADKITHFFKQLP